MPRRIDTVAPGVSCLGPWGRTQTNVYLVRSGQGSMLIDAGWESDGPRIEHAVRSVLGPTARPDGILLTHCHPDHAGAAGPLARRWGCPVWMHPDELPIATGDFTAMQAWAGPLDRLVVLPIMRAMGARRRRAVLARSSLADVARPFPDGDSVPGLPDWQRVPTPGHTPGHTSFVRRRDGVAITGDALVTLQVNSLAGLALQRPGLSGPPWYTTWDRRTADASIDAIAALGPSTIAPGHGQVLTGQAAVTTLTEVRRRPRTVHAMARPTDEQRARWTPPPWLNRLMSWMLRTPGLQRLVGRGTALLTFTGRRTGRIYTTPVSYARDGDRVIVAGHVSRTWWRNLGDRPHVELRLAGSRHRGTARVLTAKDDEALAALRTYLRQQPMTARAQRVRRDAAGAFRPEDLRRVLAESVVVEIRLAPS